MRPYVQRYSEVYCPICLELRLEPHSGFDGKEHPDTPCQPCSEEEPEAYEAWEREFCGKED